MPDETPWLVEALQPVVDKLDERLSADLSERDVLAAKQATVDAMLAGYRQGVAAAVASAETQAQRKNVTLKLEIDVDVAYHDAWAERYGEGQG